MQLRMLREMSAEDPRIDADISEMQEPYAVTYRTMGEIQSRHPGANICFVVGADKLDLIEEFGNHTGFLEKFGVVVFARDDVDPEEEILRYITLTKFRDSLFFVNLPSSLEHFSSTAIREHLFDADQVSSMLHPAVLALLRELKPDDFPEEILQFRDDYAFGDNGYPADVLFEETVYPSAEAAFQESKLKKRNDRIHFTEYRLNEVKQRGNHIVPYRGWEDEKIAIMERVVQAKFAQHPELYDKPLLTKGKRLIAGTQKKDTFWCINLSSWEGENHLGRILMRIRGGEENKNDDVHIL